MPCNDVCCSHGQNRTLSGTQYHGTLELEEINNIRSGWSYSLTGLFKMFSCWIWGIFTVQVQSERFGLVCVV